MLSTSISVSQLKAEAILRYSGLGSYVLRIVEFFKKLLAIVVNL